MEENEMHSRQFVCMCVCVCLLVWMKISLVVCAALFNSTDSAVRVAGGLVAWVQPIELGICRSLLSLALLTISCSEDSPGDPSSPFSCGL